MQNEIKLIVRKLTEENFSGHIKIGIENGAIVGMNKEFNFYKPKFDLTKTDFDNEIDSCCRNIKYGTIQFDFFEGKLINLTFSERKSADDIKSWLEKFICKFVVVVKK